MAASLTDFHQRSTHARAKILKNEEQRVQLEQKLRSMAKNNPRLYQRRHIQHIQTYFTRLNQEAERAEQRNLQLLNDLTTAQQHLDKLHHDAENLIRLKNNYLTYLESNYPNWQRSISARTSTNINSSNDYDRLSYQMKQEQDQLDNDENLRRSVPAARQSYDVDSSMLFKHYEDQLKIGLDRTTSPLIPIMNNENKDQQKNKQFTLESNEIVNTSTYPKSSNSLRMELTCTGLYVLLDHIENELKDTIDKKKFYCLDSPTIAHKRNILDIANEQQKSALNDLDPTTISMVILDQLPSTIRRTTTKNCLLTEDILSLNIKDLDKDIIAQMLPEEDRKLWLRLIEHFGQLLKLHVMNSQTLTNKFAVALLPANVLHAHDKAKSLLKHIVETFVGTQSSSDDETSIVRKQPIQRFIPSNATSSSSWLQKLRKGNAFDDDDDKSTSSSSATKTNAKSAKLTTSILNKNIIRSDSDSDFFN